MKFSEYQEAVFDWVVNGRGSCVVEAVAGSGKTTTIVHAAGLIPQSKRAVFLAFNKRVAEELKSRLPAHVEARTLNSLGHGIVFKNAGRLVLDPEKLDRVVKETIATVAGANNISTLKYPLTIAMRRVRNLGLLPREIDADVWNRVKDEVVYECDGLDKEFLASWDLNGRSFFDVLLDLVGATIHAMVAAPDIDFDDQIYLPIYHGWTVRPFDFVLVDEAQDLSPANRKLLHLVSDDRTRFCFVGDRRQCQPPETQVELMGGRRAPIRDVRVGDTVVSYHSGSATFRGLRSQGRKVLEVASRPYEGVLVEVVADGRVSRSTLEHRWLARYDEKARSKTAVYLMRRGSRWRVGISRVKYRSQSGLSARSIQEMADASWLLSVHDTKEEALVAEKIVCFKYGIPDLMFENNGGDAVSNEDITRVYEAVGDITDRAARCLSDFGRLLEHPVWARGEGNSHYGMYSSIVHASNLIEGLHVVRTFDGTTHGGRWVPVKVRRVPYIGTVHSLKVEPTEGGQRLYVSDGIVTHNSIYAFRGADNQSIHRIQEEFGTSTLPLSICYRCPKDVVRMAQGLSPEIEWHDENDDGKVSVDAERFHPNLFEANDLIVCRLNAPIIKAALQLARAGKRCVVLGRDFGRSLSSLVKSFRCRDIEEVPDAASRWKTKKVKTLLDMGRDMDSPSVVAIVDKHEALMHFLTEMSPRSIAEYLGMIESLFSDDEDGRSIVLSTVHKAKGKEFDRVFVLDAGYIGRFKKSRGDDQESNIMYVAVTRAKRELGFVDLSGTRASDLYRDMLRDYDRLKNPSPVAAAVGA
jgi:superfamily I DNA/RNA helicase